MIDDVQEASGEEDGRWLQYDQWEEYERAKREAGHADFAPSEAYDRHIDEILRRLEL